MLILPRLQVYSGAGHMTKLFDHLRHYTRANKCRQDMDALQITAADEEPPQKQKGYNAITQQGKPGKKIIQPPGMEKFRTIKQSAFE